VSSAFSRELARRNTDPAGRRWLFVPYDQLTDGIGPLSREDPAELGIVLIESAWKAARRPYHRQKLALLLANLRHFALEQAGRGVAVVHRFSRAPYRVALERTIDELGIPSLRVMRPAERELRVDLAPLLRSKRLEEIPHEGWLTDEDQFRRSRKGRTWRMDAFYRLVRRESGILMDGRRPEGGKFSFDTENRKPWPGEPAAAVPPRFPRDEIKQEVAGLIEARYARHPGRVDLDALPATRDDAERLWAWARSDCLPHFGPYEDAMSVRSSNLFHTRVSALLNLHRLLPDRVVGDVATLELPVAGREGFVRQVLGWREFVRHVHEATDGFRRFPDGSTPERIPVGDGGFRRWSGEPWRDEEDPADGEDAAAPSHLGANGPLPVAFWGRESGLRCLDHVVEGVWEEAYGHHITRLMVLSNLATLLDVSPRELTDWFWVAYADAYDWVVEPNVLGMGTFAAGDLMTTKPYVSGAAYIDRMSDYCGDCAFDPKKSCPVTRMYWAFLDRHRRRLEGNPRLRLPLASLDRRSPERRAEDRAVLDSVREALGTGTKTSPADLLSAS
jgi:deoxyribodipyrimidine photolyase-related protein